MAAGGLFPTPVERGRDRCRPGSHRRLAQASSTARAPDRASGRRRLGHRRSSGLSARRRRAPCPWLPRFEGQTPGRQIAVRVERRRRLRLGRTCHHLWLSEWPWELCCTAGRPRHPLDFGLRFPHPRASPPPRPCTVKITLSDMEPISVQVANRARGARVPPAWATTVSSDRYRRPRPKKYPPLL